MPKRQGYNLALTVLHVPYSLDSSPTFKLVAVIGGGVLQEQKMLKGYLPRDIYHQVYLYAETAAGINSHPSPIKLKQIYTLVAAPARFVTGSTLNPET